MILRGRVHLALTGQFQHLGRGHLALTQRRAAHVGHQHVERNDLSGPGFVGPSGNCDC